MSHMRRSNVNSKARRAGSSLLSYGLVRKAFAPDLRQLNSEPEPDRAPLPEQQNGPMPVRAAPSATLLIATSLSHGNGQPSRPPLFPQCGGEIRRRKIHPRKICPDPCLDLFPPSAW